MMRMLRALGVALCLLPSLAAAQDALPPYAPPGQLKSYLGQVATRAAFPDSLSTVPSFTQGMARSLHIARDNLGSVQVAFAGFYLKAGSGEQPTTGATAVTASIEYPAGTFTQLKFGGSASGSIPAGSYLFSDQATVAIPANARFWIRMWTSNANGYPYSAYQVNNAVPMDSLIIGNSIPDQTMSGTVGASTFTNTAMYPIAIIGQTTRASGCLIGDSRVTGWKDVRDDASGDGGQIAKYIGPRFAYIRMSVATDTLAGTVSSFANRAYFGRYCTFGVDEYGVNDLYNLGRTAAQVAADRATLAGFFPGLKMFGATLSPFTNSTDSWASQTGQSLPSSTVETARLTFNDLIRTGIAGEVNYIDVADAIDPGRVGKLPSNGTANYCTSDGIHETAVCARIIRDSNIWTRLDFGR